MRIEIDGDGLKVNLIDLLNNLSLENKRRLADAIACQGDVVKDVISQVLSGCTESGSYSGILCTASANPEWPGLDWACREVAKRAGETAKREIKRLEDALKHKDELLQKLHDENQHLRQPRSDYGS